MLIENRPPLNYKFKLHVRASSSVFQWRQSSVVSNKIWIGITDAICYQTGVIFESEFQTKYEQNQKMSSILTNIRRAEGTSPLSVKHQMDL